MCLSAIYWAGISKVYYANTKHDAAAIDFADNFIYEEIAKPYRKRNIPFIHIDYKQAIDHFKKWLSKEDKINFLDLLRQFIIVDGQPSELEKQVQKKFAYELGDDVIKRFPGSKTDKKKLIAAFSKKPQATKNIV